MCIGASGKNIILLYNCVSLGFLYHLIKKQEAQNISVCVLLSSFIPLVYLNILEIAKNLWPVLSSLINMAAMLKPSDFESMLPELMENNYSIAYITRFLAHKVLL